MKKILTTFLAVFAVITMTRAAEGGTLTSSATPIDPSETVTLTYDGTGTNFANWQPSCFIHAWLVAADGQTFSKSYSTAWASCNGDNDYAALDSKVKMTYANVAGKYTISMNIKSFFNVEDADLPKIAKLGVIVRAQYEGDNNKTNDMFVNVAVASQGGGETPTPENDVTLYYVNNTNWTTVNAYTWKGEGNAYKTWPGEAMTKTNDKANGKDVYSYTFPESYNKIIFNDGSNQTSDLTWNANEPYYFDGEWYESLAAIPAAVAPAKFYITGDTALVVSAGKDKNMAWHSNAIKVEKDSFVFENMAAGIYHMKVSLDGTWNDGQVKGYNDLTVKPAGVTADNDGNICFTLAEAGRVVVTYKVDNEVVTFTVAGNFFVETPAKFYITGDTALVVSGGADKMKAWKADAIKVEKDSFVFENMAAGDYHMKVVVDGNWEGGQVKGYNDLTVKPAGVTADNDGNICFTLAEAGRVVVTYKVENEVTTFTVAGNFYVAPVEPVKYYIAGSMTEWETNKVELVEAATDSFRVVITLEADSLYEYKVVSVQGENKVWYGLGGYAKMEENNCTGWWFYSDGSSNVGLQSGAAGSYTFIVKMRDGHAEVTVIYPEATSIISLEGRDEVRKVMRNGQIYIIKNGTVYNALGAIVE